MSISEFDHPQILELVGIEEMAFIDEQEHPPPPFALSASQSVSGLGDQRSTMEPGCTTQAATNKLKIPPPPTDGLAQ